MAWYKFTNIQLTLHSHFHKMPKRFSRSQPQIKNPGGKPGAGLGCTTCLKISLAHRTNQEGIFNFMPFGGICSLAEVSQNVCQAGHLTDQFGLERSDQSNNQQCDN